MSRYSKMHYEDVARILLEYTLLSHVSPMTRDLVNTFADLFAADNPKRCEVGGHDGPCTGHESVGFNRKKFLAACGLEPISPGVEGLASIREEGDRT